MHKVQKISLHMSAASYQQASEQQRLAKNWAENTLPHLLDKVLTNVAPSHDYKYIDTLQLQIPTQPWTLPDAEWERLLLLQLGRCQLLPLAPEKVLPQFFSFLQKGYCAEKHFFGTVPEYERYWSPNIIALAEALTAAFQGKLLSHTQIHRLFTVISDAFYEVLSRHIFGLKPSQNQYILQKIQSLAQRKVGQLEVFLSEIVTVIHVQKIIVDDAAIDHLAQKAESTTPARHLQKKAVFAPEESGGASPEGIVAPAAGLVLLLPFFKNFFEALGLLATDDFVDDTSRNLGAHALHYLAYGSKPVADTELLVPKILCGLAPDTLLPTAQLPDFIKAEAEDLLMSVLQHWPQLNGSTAAALRESFLQRPGRLLIHPEQYTFQIENSGIDVLLSGLPWGFRHFRLAWLSKTIITEWY